MNTLVLSGEDDSAIARAIQSLQSGEIVGLPTETVYGLAADALNVNAVLKIFEAKERPRFDPLIVHLPEQAWTERVTNVPAVEKEIVDCLIATFWPGPLTLVLPRRGIIPDVVAAGLGTVAIRISANPTFDRIVRGLGRPLAAPSANRFGRISPTTAAHVLGELEGRIPLIVDGGPTTHGLESTIVAVRYGRIEILRHGPITAEQLATFGELAEAKHRDRLEAPGQLPSHYAPQTPFQLASDLATFEPPDGKRVGALALRDRLRGNLLPIEHSVRLAFSAKLPQICFDVFAN